LHKIILLTLAVPCLFWGLERVLKGFLTNLLFTSQKSLKKQTILSFLGAGAAAGAVAAGAMAVAAVAAMANGERPEVRDE
jgi:hypothetical protein